MKEKKQMPPFSLKMRVKALFLFLSLLVVNPSSAQEGVLKKIESKQLFQSDKFLYPKEEIVMELELTPQGDLQGFSGVLLFIESNNKTRWRVVLDWSAQRNLLNLFVLRNSTVKKQEIPVDSAFLKYPVRVNVTINFISDLAQFTINDQSITLHNLDFSIHNGYKFDLLPELAYSTNPNFIPLFIVSKADVYVSGTPSRNKVWMWFLVIIVVDLIIFLLIHRHKKKKKKRKENDETMVYLQGEPEGQVELPTQGAIYILGRFHVYDAEGEDITKNFSPLLKELLCLLIVYSTRKGISFNKLKELLWRDKSDASAKNNRAVYFGRLREALKRVGDFELTNETGYWKMHSTTAFIDYHRYKELISQEKLTPEQVEELLAVLSNGNLLPTGDYEWMDTFKDEISNRVIHTLLNLTGNINIDAYPRQVSRVADIIFKFDYLNEQALYLKYKAYSVLGQHASAKVTYDKFREEYEKVYGVPFGVSFQDMDSMPERDATNLL